MTHMTFFLRFLILRHLRSTPLSSMTKIVAETIVCQGTPGAMWGCNIFLD